ncbi:hypothetical protein LTR91_016880 [Friedmanniomyces endolithicus]|uniref:Uncharacterized protein n=1 Tax=Friedmanniomyces endolithicus TaxID=329885 RepID=A0AAN6QL54_9PEZI|nr:hypothetical protein LTR57_018857 [Friedmanniomyces endolithicus]KAK0968132.1 hypothetical protein LTR91_016880 [Friedmanniomyces endolithicus]
MLRTDRYYSLRHATIIYLIPFFLSVSAQTLLFTAPATNALTALGATNNYTLGQDVQIAWQTGFQKTTLRVWQGPREDGSLIGKVLAENRTQVDTSFTWTAAQIDNIPLSRPFHFELTNAEDGSCTGCAADSADFYVTRPSATTSSTSTSTSSTPAPTTSSAPSSSSTATTTPFLHNNRHALALGLGIGLGVGVPLLLALLALCAFCPIRRRKNQRRSANLPRGHQPKLSISAPLMVQHDKAVGPPGSPGYPQIAYFGAYRPERPDRGDEAQRDRSSTGTASTMASSYHGPFEFERPGSGPGFDSKSMELEMSSIPRSSPQYAQSGRAGSSASGSQRTGTPKSDHNHGGGRRLTSIDEHGPPLRARTPEWPLRS